MLLLLLASKWHREITSDPCATVGINRHLFCALPDDPCKLCLGKVFIKGIFWIILCRCLKIGRCLKICHQPVREI